jgi:hypothetical protein
MRSHSQLLNREQQSNTMGGIAELVLRKLNHGTRNCGAYFRDFSEFSGYMKYLCQQKVCLNSEQFTVQLRLTFFQPTDFI